MVWHLNKFRAAGKHFQQGGQVRSSSAAFQLRGGGEKREREREKQFVGRSGEKEGRGKDDYNSLNKSLLLDRNELELDAATSWRLQVLSEM